MKPPHCAVLKRAGEGGVERALPSNHSRHLPEGQRPECGEIFRAIAHLRPTCRRWNDGKPLGEDDMRLSFDCPREGRDHLAEAEAGIVAMLPEELLRTADLVERWRPDSVQPEIADGMLTWQPSAEAPALVIDLEAVFAEVFGES